MLQSTGKQKAGKNKAIDMVSLGPIYRYASKNPLRLLPEVFIVIVMLSYLTVASGLTNYGLFYTDAATVEPILKVGIVFATWMGLILMAELVCRIGLNASKNHLSLTVNTALSMTPYIIFLALYTALNQLTPLPDPLNSPLTLTGLIATHVWFLLAFTRGVQYAKKVARSYAAMIGLASYYINVIMLLLIIL